MKSVLRPWPAGFRGLPTLTLCVNFRKEQFVASCGRAGGVAIRERLEHELEVRQLDLEFQTIACLGLCAKGPNARLAPANTWFHAITAEDVPELLDVVAGELARLSTKQIGDTNV